MSHADTIYPLTPDELNQLATFNAEVARGLVHTQTHREKMADLQHRFNKAVTFRQPMAASPDGSTVESLTSAITRYQQRLRRSNQMQKRGPNA